MNMRWKTAVFMIIMASAAVQATAGAHDTASGHSAYRDSTAGITEQNAITIAQRHFEGRVLAINQTGHAYRVKILSSQGRIHVVLIDVQHGTVISSH